MPFSLRRYFALAGAVAVAGGLAVTAPAAHAATTVSATTQITGRPDSGYATQTVNTTNTWATDDMTRTVSVTLVGSHSGAECGTLSPCYQYTGSVQDTSGKFTTVTGGVSPNAGAALVSPPVKGTFTGCTVMDVTFYADSNSPSDVRVPNTATGSSPIDTSHWLTLLFPAGTHFNGDLLPTWSWTYKDAGCEQWVDAYNVPQASSGDITGADACTDTVTVTTPASQSWTAGTPASLQIAAASTDPNVTLTYAATGLPAGLSIDSSTGLISGTPATASSFTATVTATSSRGHAGSASFDWTVQAATVTPPPVTYSNVVVIRNRLSGKCLNDGAARGMEQYTCGAYASEKFRVATHADGTTYLQSAEFSAPKYVQDGALREQLSLTSSETQIHLQNGGIFRFGNGLVMDDKGLSKSNFAQAIGFTFNGQDNQRWDFQNAPA